MFEPLTYSVNYRRRMRYSSKTRSFTLNRSKGMDQGRTQGGSRVGGCPPPLEDLGVGGVHLNLNHPRK